MEMDAWGFDVPPTFRNEVLGYASHSTTSSRAVITPVVAYATMLVAIRALLSSPGTDNAFVLVYMFPTMLLVQWGATAWHTDPYGRKSMPSSHWTTAMLPNVVQLLVQNTLRLVAMYHFGLLFGLLLEFIDSLLLQRLKRACGMPMDGPLSLSSLHSIQANSGMWDLTLAVVGLTVVAGVDAQQYGSLVRTTLIILTALVTSEVKYHIPTLRLHQDQVELQSASLVACTVLSLIGYTLGVFQLVLDTSTIPLGGFAEDFGVVTWFICLVLCAVSQYVAKRSYRQSMESSELVVDVALQVKTSLASVAMAGLTSFVYAVYMHDWLHCITEPLALSILLYTLSRQYASTRHSDDISTHVDPSSSSISAKKILQSLLKREDSRRMLLFLAVNVSFMFVEFVVGFWSNSLGLIGDAGHMLFDNSALVIGLAASYVGQLPANNRFTYGYGRVEVLSGFFNSLFLLFISVHLLAEAFTRFFDPPEVTTDHLLLTSVLGLIVNLVGLVWFHDQAHGHSHDHSHDHGHSHDHSHESGVGNSNMYGVYLHVLADTLGSVGVIISSLLIEYKDWHIADPLSSAMIALLIFGSTIPLLKETVEQLLQRVPKKLEKEVNTALMEVRSTVYGVVDIEKWNVWRHSNDDCVGSVHVLVSDNADMQYVVEQTRRIFTRYTQIDRFLTVQVSKQYLAPQQGSHDHSIGAKESLEVHGYKKMNHDYVVTEAGGIPVNHQMHYGQRHQTASMHPSRNENWNNGSASVQHSDGDLSHSHDHNHGHEHHHQHPTTPILRTRHGSHYETRLGSEMRASSRHFD